jgi:hypothetical protein
MRAIAPRFHALLEFLSAGARLLGKSVADFSA